MKAFFCKTVTLNVLLTFTNQLCLGLFMLSYQGASQTATYNFPAEHML